MGGEVASEPRSKQRLLAMDEVDAADFSDLLRAHFPDIRFVDFEYWRLRLPKAPYYINREPPNLQVSYCSSLADFANDRFRVWREPVGWRPNWAGPNEHGVYPLTNMPRVHFVFERGRGANRPTSKVLHCGRIWAYYDVGDREHLQFLNQVWRLSAKLSSNIVQRVDRDTQEPLGLPGRDPVWIGKHAAQWCLEDPRRTIDENRRPPDPSRAAP